MIDWNDPANRMAAVRLLREQRLIRGARTQEAVRHFEELGWVVQPPRGPEVALAPLAAPKLERLLGQVWAAWAQAASDLAAVGLPLTAEGLAELGRSRCLREIGPESLPSRLHHKTLAALLTAHSKTGLATLTLERHTGIVATTDSVLRLRPSAGLALVLPDGTLAACDSAARVLGEVVVPERALLDGASLGGRLPQACLTVENLGAYVDLPKPPDLLAVHVPGWESPLTRQLLKSLPQNVPLHHFGDLDPEGLRIRRHLEEALGRPVGLFAPRFWLDYADSHGQAFAAGEEAWGAGDSWPECPLVPALAAIGRWLEQEPIVTDPRMWAALAAL